MFCHCSASGRCFRLASARRFGWRVDRMLLIDDSETYVAAAREAGTVGHLFRGIDGLRAELGGLGL